MADEMDNGAGPALMTCPGYTWSQTQSTVTLVFEVPATVTVMDIMVTFQSDQLIAGVEGAPPLISGTLHQLVTESECSWERQLKQDYAVVLVHLAKAVSIEWQVPIKSGCGPRDMIDPQSEYELAKYYVKSGNMLRALEHMRRAADGKLVFARVHLGNIYNVGHQGRYPIKKDIFEAIRQYELAASENSGEAMYLLATIWHYGGESVDRDISKAVDLYKRCIRDQQANHDHLLSQRGKFLNQHRATALFNLGIIYQSSEKEGFPDRDFDQALSWWHQAADQGFAPAMYNLGVVYLKGLGLVPPDGRRAREFFAKANAHNSNLKIPDLEDPDDDADAEGVESSGPSTPIIPRPSADRDVPPPCAPQLDAEDPTEPPMPQMPQMPPPFVLVAAAAMAIGCLLLLSNRKR